MARTSKRSQVLRPRSVGVLLVCLLVSSGCFTILQDIQNVRMRLANLRQPISGLPTTYLQFRGRGKSEPRIGFVRAGYLIQQPFDLSVTAGVFDQNLLQDADGQRACLEIDERPDGSPLSFAVICGDYSLSMGGYNVFYSHNLDGTLVSGGTTFFPGAAVDYRIAGDGADLTFSARSLGATAWTDLGAIAYVRDPGLAISVGGAYLNKGGEVGFTNGWLVDGPHFPGSIEDEIYDDLMYAEEHLFFYCLYLEIGDEAAALDELLDAASHVDDAYAGIDLLTQVRGAGAIDPKALKKAAKNVGKAQKKIAKAQAKLAAGKIKSAAKQTGKAIKSADKAAITFQPFANVI